MHHPFPMLPETPGTTKPHLPDSSLKENNQLSDCLAALAMFAVSQWATTCLSRRLVQTSQLHGRKGFHLCARYHIPYQCTHSLCANLMLSVVLLLSHERYGYHIAFLVLFQALPAHWTAASTSVVVLSSGSQGLNETFVTEKMSTRCSRRVGEVLQTDNA